MSDRCCSRCGIPTSGTRLPNCYLPCLLPRWLLVTATSRESVVLPLLSVTTTDTSYTLSPLASSGTLKVRSKHRSRSTTGLRPRRSVFSCRYHVGNHSPCCSVIRELKHLAIDPGQRPLKWCVVIVLMRLRPSSVEIRRLVIRRSGACKRPSHGLWSL